MDTPKSKVISIRVNDQKLIEFYENNQASCRNSMLESLTRLSGSTSPIGTDKRTDIPNVEADNNLHKISDILDDLVQSDDFENRADEIVEVVTKSLKNSEEIISRLEPRDSSIERHSELLRSIRFYGVMIAILVIIAITFNLAFRS